MNQNILIKISFYFKKYDDFKNLSLCNKSTTQIKNNYSIYFFLLKKYFTYFKKHKILKYLQQGPFKKFANKYPILKWKTEYLGFSGYIDSIFNNQLNDSIMIGIDHYKRSFITIGYMKNNKIGCITYFQRYEHYSSNWVWGGDTFYGYGNNCLNTHDLPNILYLLDEMENNQEIIYNNSTYRLIKREGGSKVPPNPLLNS